MVTRLYGNVKWFLMIFIRLVVLYKYRTCKDLSSCAMCTESRLSCSQALRGSQTGAHTGVCWDTRRGLFGA